PHAKRDTRDGASVHRQPAPRRQHRKAFFHASSHRRADRTAQPAGNGRLLISPPTSLKEHTVNRLVETPVIHKEPTPITDRENPFESMMKRFDIAAEILGLEQGLYEYLKTPVKQIIVSIPIKMDDGRIEIFEGYRVIHNDILGPSKGGIRYAPDV